MNRRRLLERVHYAIPTFARPEFPLAACGALATLTAGIELVCEMTSDPTKVTCLVCCATIEARTTLAALDELEALGRTVGA